MPLWLRVWKDDDIGPVMDTLRVLDARRHDPDGPADPQHRPAGLGRSPSASSGGRSRGRSRATSSTRSRASSRSAAGRCASRSTATRRSSTTASPRSRPPSSASRAPRCGAPSARREDIPSLEHPAERIQGGVPNLEWNNMTGWYGGEEGGHIGFSPVAPLTGHDALAVRDLLRGMIEEAGLDYMAGLIPINARSFIHVAMVIFDTKDEAQARAAYDVTQRLVREAAQAGLRRVPRAPGLHGPRGRPVQLQRPRLPALHRDVGDAAFGNRRVNWGKSG